MKKTVIIIAEPPLRVCVSASAEKTVKRHLQQFYFKLTADYAADFEMTASAKARFIEIVLKASQALYSGIRHCDLSPRD